MNLTFKQAIQVIQAKTLKDYVSQHLGRGKSFSFTLRMNGDEAHDSDHGDMRVSRDEQEIRKFTYQMILCERYESIEVDCNYTIAQEYFKEYQVFLKDHWEKRVKAIQKAKRDLESAGLTVDDLKTDTSNL